MIERRDQVIDEGIERLESAFALGRPRAGGGGLADKLIREVAEVTAADDDVALVVMRFLGSPVGPSRTAPATWRRSASGPRPDRVTPGRAGSRVPAADPARCGSA